MMRKIKSLLMMICFVSTFLLSGCDQITDLLAQFGGEEETVQFELDNMTLVEGEEATLPSEITVGEKTFTVEYSSDGDNVAVDGNKITALAKGKCQINVSAEGASGSFTVTVKERGILSVRSVTLKAGETAQIKATLSSKDLDCEVIFTFEGNDIEINDGEVKAITPGTVTTVTATTPYHSATFTVTVEADYGTMTVKGPSSIYSNYPGRPIEITFSKPECATDVTFTSNVSGVRVENGLVYATGTFDEPVTATITARSEHHKASFDVIVSTFFGSHNEEKKVSYYEKNIIANENNHGGLIFIGDSYFDGYTMDSPPFWSDFYDDYAGEKAFLMGISASGINDWEIVSERIVFPMQPSEIAVHIGFNDIHHSSITPENLAIRIITLLESYKEALPDVKVYYFGIEPKKNAFTSDQYRESSLVNAPKVNKIISDYAKNTDWLIFLDTDPYTYTTSGKNAVNQDFYLSVDLSHPTLAAYDNYRKLLESVRSNNQTPDEEPGTDEGPSVEEIVSAITFANVELKIGEEKTMPATVTVGGKQIEVKYTAQNGNVLISGSKIKARLSGECIITVSAGAASTTFTVTVKEEIGTMTVTGPSTIYSNYPGKPVTVKFSNENYASAVTYTSDTEGVYVENGLVYAKGTFANPVTATITAKTEHHTATFTVTVSTYFGNHNEETKVTYYEENIISDSKNHGGLIFVGDSYFDGYTLASPPFWKDFYTDYANEKAFLMGISSSGINEWEIVSERIVFPMNPSEIAVHIGFNDIHSSNITPEELAARIIALLESYKAGLPEVTVYYFGIEPKKNAFTNDQYKNSSLVNAPKVNKIISDYAKRTDWLIFLDTDPYTYTSADKTAIDQSFYLTTDLSHPTLPAYDGYRKMLNDARGVETPEEDATGTTSFSINNYGNNQNINDTGRYITDKNGQNLTNNFVVKGKLTVSRINKSNAHIQFRFSQNFRFILWDNDNDGKFAAGYIGGGTVNDKTAGVTEPYDANSELTLEWAIAVKDGKAYWYVGGVLVGSFDAPTLQYFNIGALQVDVSFTDVTVAVKSDDESAYNAAIASLGIN